MSNWPTNPDATVNIHQVRDLYGNVSVRTIKRYVKIGRLPPPDDEKRPTWRAGTVTEYRKAWEWVRLVRRAAKKQRLTASGQSERAGGHNLPNESADEKTTGGKRKPG